ncbi:MAG: hypothetical protein Kow0037_25550 [Calditrichia bacterium]
MTKSARSNKTYSTGLSSQVLFRGQLLTGIFFIGLAGLVAFVWLIIALKFSGLVAIGALLGMAGIATFIFKPHWATLFTLFVIYSNINVIAYKFHGVPLIIAGSLWLALLIPFAVYIFFLKRELRIDYIFLLMLVYLATLLLSMTVAKDKSLAWEWIFTFILEGLVLYFLFLNTIRTRQHLVSAIWLLLLTGAILGALTLYQDLTGDFTNDFGGLAQRDLRFGLDNYEYSRDRDQIKLAYRAFGNIGDPNHFARILIIILPLGFFRILAEKRFLSKMLAFTFTMLILSGILLTYSRGAFLTICIMGAIMVGLKYIKWHQVVLGLFLLAIGTIVFAPGYLQRIDTIKGIKGIFSKKAAAQSDEVILNRTTEMLAAFHVFLDHPIIGVGPGQFIHFYSLDYMNNPDIAYKHFKVKRAAHSFQAEMAAELGLLGFIAFHLSVFYALLRMWTARRKWVTRDPEIAGTLTGLILGIIGYFGTSLFLSFVYQRYYWVYLALCGAILQIIENPKEN